MRPSYGGELLGESFRTEGPGGWHFEVVPVVVGSAEAAAPLAPASSRDGAA